jgi:nucleotide-binding universal stress UspA family protein
MYSRILVPVDGSAPSLKGLNEAIKLAKATGATLRLVHVVNELVMDSGYLPASYYDQMIAILREQGKKVLAAAVAAARDQGMTVESEMIETVGGPAATSILEAAKIWGAQLIVMGTHGRRGLLRLAMGSDAELVLRSATVPVLLVRTESAG